MMAMTGPAGAAERLRGLVLQSEALCASAAAQGQPSDMAAAQTTLLQLHSLLSVTAAAEPSSRRAADGLLQQCTARLHGLTMQRHRSEARWVEGAGDGQAVACSGSWPADQAPSQPSHCAGWPQLPPSVAAATHSGSGLQAFPCCSPSLAGAPAWRS